MFGRLEITYLDGRTAVIELTKRQVLVGRASDADVSVPDTLVSRRHAVLLCGPEGVRIVDAGSANGTFLGADRLPAEQPVPLTNGAEVRVGHTRFRYRAPSPKETGAPRAAAEPPPASTEPEYETFIKSAPAPVAPGEPPAGPPPDFAPPPPQTPPAETAEPPPAGPPQRPPDERSRYLQFLPPIFSTDDFMGRFLLIFEDVLSPIERTVGNLHHYFDPRVTPPDLLPWLASWLGLVLDERWPEAQRRALIQSAVDLYQWRGTRRGLTEFLRLYTGFTPEIIEAPAGRAADGEGRAFRFVVRIRVPDPARIDRSVLESIINAEKPAHTGYSLELVAE